MEQEKIQHFYRNWQENLPSLVDGYLYDQNQNPLPPRTVFVELRQVVERFLTNQLEHHEKILILPGIRGVGKTTLLMQLYKAEKFPHDDDAHLLKALGQLEERLYLDVSRLTLEGISLQDFFQFYETVKNFRFERSQKKCLLLLDEAHYDEHWGLFLKSMFDRTKGHRNLLIVATGSSSLHLRSNPDLSRRAVTREVYPMKFDEYVLMACQQKLPRTCGNIQEIMFHSATATEVYQALRTKSPDVERFFSSLPRGVENDFFTMGNFPFTAGMANAIKAVELVKSVINSIIAKDILGLKKFKTQTIAKIGSLLYLVANSDVVAYEKLRAALKIERFETLESLIEVLILSGMVMKVPSFGRTYGSTRKTPKLLFTAPALRAAVLENAFPAGVEGKKLEDYFALLYLKDLKERYAAELRYDAAEGGADFVLVTKNDNIIVEVGFHKESTAQVARTQAKIASAYGIVFGGKHLELASDAVVKVPLSYLLLA